MTDLRRIGPVLAVALGAAGCAHEPTQPMQLVWSDEFEGEALDPAKWSVAHDCWGGGNEERQCYSPTAVAVRDGRLSITARREPGTGPSRPRDPASEPATKPYTSGLIHTQGKAAWRYGRFEMRARLPVGQGLWAAFWMLPHDHDYGRVIPAGEIDILEAVNTGSPCRDWEGERENRVWAALHAGGEQRPGRSLEVWPRPWEDFHVYAVDWTPTGFSWSVDGRVFARAEAAGAPFDTPYHLILNLAVGGRWPESTAAGGIDEAAFPAALEVDWVRVWTPPGT